MDDKNDYNQNLQDQKSKNQILHSKSDMLEHERSELLRDYEEEVSVSEVLTIELKNTKSKLNNLETKFATIKATMNLDRIEKERSCFEQSKSSLQIEALSDTNDELTKEIKALSLFINNAKKDAKDQFNEKEKMILKQVKIIEELENFKSIKNWEEKELKSKLKKVDKKLKAIGEREAKLKLQQKEADKRLELDVDENENESNRKLKNENLATSELATENLNDSFNNTNPEASNGSDIVEVIDENLSQVLIKAKEDIRERFKASIKKKVEVKLMDERFKHADFDPQEIEEDLLAEMEDNISEEIAAVKYQLEVSTNAELEYEIEEWPPSYWNGEDLGEIVYESEELS